MDLTRGRWIKPHYDDIHDLYSSTKSRVRWVEHIVYVGENNTARRVLVKTLKKEAALKTYLRMKYDIKVDFRIGTSGMKLCTRK